MGSTLSRTATGHATVRRLMAAACGIFVGIAGSSLLVSANAAGFVAGAVFLLIALLIAAAVTPERARHDVVLLVAFAVALRFAAATVLHDGLVVTGRGGFVTGDDANYADLSWALVRLLRGESFEFNFSAQAYLLGTFVYLETALFAVFGPNVVVVNLLNGAFAGVLVALTCDIGRRVFGSERGALLAGATVAVYPSLVLWSSLNLKDSLALMLIAVVLWLLAVVGKKPTAWITTAMYAPLMLMESLRAYIFVGLALVIPVGVLLAYHRDLRSRITLTAVAVALSGAFLVAHATDAGGLPSWTLQRLESQRAAMGIGARTGFAGPPLVPVAEGQTYVVAAPPTAASTASSVPSSASARPTAPATSSPSPRVVVVQPGSRIVVATTRPSGQSPRPSADPSDVVVVPGDIVVVGPSGSTPAPASERKVLEVGPRSGTVQLAASDNDALAVRTIRYLPQGIAFALFAPLPWSIERPLDLLPIPEMLLWYSALVAGVVSLWHRRCEWRRLGPLVLFVAGTLLVFALAEGNVGTLYRHRAMVIPFVLIAASPVFVQLFAVALTRQLPSRV